jgi:hypothetical protein
MEEKILSRLTFFQGLLLNLEQIFAKEQLREYLTREEAYKLLKEHTGQNFGYDAEAWREWLQSQGKLHD